MKIRVEYDAQLTALTENLIHMGALAAEGIQQAVLALQQGNKELAKQVIAGDREIDALEKNIEHACLNLILRQQPVASDLRRVSCALKMITDIERVGDAASDIAELSCHMPGGATDDLLDPLLDLAGCVRTMVESAIDSYVKGDLELARAVMKQDDEADALFCRAREAVVRKIAAQPDGGELALDHFMAAKYLERVGDHAVNICEWVEFSKTGIHKDSKIV